MPSLSVAIRVRAQLRREMRTQWSALLSLSLTLLGLVIGILIATRRDLFSDEIGLHVVLGCSFTAALLILGSECVAGELARGTLASVARTPGGLRSAFWSKLFLFGAGVLLSSSLGPLLYAALEGGDLAPAQRLLALPFHEVAVLAYVVLPAVGLALWVFAASAWTPSGVLALPTAVLISLALAAAFWFTPRPFQEFALHGEDALFFVPAYLVGGFLAARGSMLHGPVDPAARGRAALAGLGASAWVLTPAFLIVALRPDLSSLVLLPSSVRIHNAVLSPAEDHLLLRVSQPAGFMPWLGLRSPRLGRLWAALPHGKARITRGVRVGIGTGDWEWNRATTPPEESPGPRQAWKKWSELPDLSRHGLTPQAIASMWCGLGRIVYPGQGEEPLLWDPVRDLVVPYASVVDPDLLEQVLVRRTDWLVRRATPEADQPLTWFRFDPLAATWEVARGIGFSSLLGSPVLADDRVISNGAVEGAVLVDPVSGRRHILHTASGARVEAIRDMIGTDGKAPSHGSLVVNTWVDGGMALALLEPDEAQVHLLTTLLPHTNPAWQDRWLDQLADGRILAQRLDPVSILLIDPVGGTRTQLFP